MEPRNTEQHSQVTARVEGGESLPVETVDLPGAEGDVRASAGATVTVISTAQQLRNSKNPNNEETIRVRVKPGQDFFFEGDLVKEGDEFDMPLSIARRSGQAVEYLEPLPVATVIRGIPNLELMADHEQVEALEAELKRLEEGADSVRRRLEAARERVNARVQVQQQAEARRVAQLQTDGGQPQQVVQPVRMQPTAPNTSTPAYTPGTPGAPGTTAVPPRPTEPGPGAGGVQSEAGTTGAPGSTRIKR